MRYRYATSYESDTKPVETLGGELDARDVRQAALRCGREASKRYPKGRTFRSVVVTWPARSIDPHGKQQTEERQRRRQRVHRESVPEALPQIKGSPSIRPNLRREKPASGCVDPAISRAIRLRRRFRTGRGRFWPLGPFGIAVSGSHATIAARLRHQRLLRSIKWRLTHRIREFCRPLARCRRVYFDVCVKREASVVRRLAVLCGVKR